MGWITILYVTMAALSATIAGIYLAAWLMQREDWSYLMFVLLAVSVVGVAGTELWMLRAQTPEDYGTALRWFQVPIWSGILALVGLVYLRLRPRFPWVGWLAVGLRTVALVANFGSAPNLNYAALTGIDRIMLLGEPVAIVTGVPNPWMLSGQASLVLLLLLIIDGGVSAWRRGEGVRALGLVTGLLVLVALGTVQAVLVFWGFVRMPVLITPLFLLTAVVMGAELSFGLLRAARAEREVRKKDTALNVSEQRLGLAAEAADAGFWSLDTQSGEVWATGKTRELFALAPVGGLRVADFLERVHPQDRARLEELIEAALRGPTSRGRNPWEFVVVTAPDQLLQAETMMAEFGNAYPWNDSRFNDAWRAEIKTLAGAMTARNDSTAIVLTRKFLSLREDRRQSASLDSALVRLEQLREWEEGLAKYTELAIWKNAAGDTAYHPDKSMNNVAHFDGYKLFANKWLQELMTLRMQPQGDEIRFYYAGMAEGFLLDRLYPDWKAEIFIKNVSLENLLKKAVNATAD